MIFIACWINTRSEIRSKLRSYATAGESPFQCVLPKAPTRGRCENKTQSVYQVPARQSVLRRLIFNAVP